LSIKIEQNRNRDFSLEIESKSIVWQKSHIVTVLVAVWSGRGACEEFELVPLVNIW